MTARAYRSPDPEGDDFDFPPDVVTLAVRVRCRCGVRTTPFSLAASFAAALRTVKLPGSLLAGAHWCRHCKRRVKVTVRDLLQAA